VESDSRFLGFLIALEVLLAKCMWLSWA